MKTFLKRVGIGFGALAGLIGITLVIIHAMSQAKLTKVYSLTQETVVIPTDAEAIAWGKHIYQFRGCQACHGGTDLYGALLLEAQPNRALPHQFLEMDRLQGNVYLDDPAIGQVNASNLTTGRGGVASAYTDAGWVFAIRHGIRSDGTGLLFMPSTEFYFLSDKDLGAVIAYIKSVQPVDHELPRSQLSLTGRILMALVPGLTFIPAEIIPHHAPRPVAPEVGATPAYGEYLTQSCKVCHGLGMSGGVIPGFPSSWPPASNLTWGDGSALARWSEADFIAALRTGQRPQGLALRAAYMPWTSFKYMSDIELKAVWKYLESLPKKDYGSR